MIHVTFDTRALERSLSDLEREQLPFAMSKTLNDIAIRAADAQRLHMRRVFMIRNEGVLKYGIVRTETATKRRLISAVGVSDRMTGNREAFGYLKKFEEGVTKAPVDGKTVAVPQAVKRTKRDLVARSQRIPAFNLKPVPTSTGAPRIVGDKRTFLIRVRKGGKLAALILQRTGPKRRRTKGRGTNPKAGVRVLYALERSVRTPKILHLVTTAIYTAQRELASAWNAAWDLALRTAVRR